MRDALQRYQLQSILDQVTYKPGWEFAIEQVDNIQDLHIRILVTTADANNPEADKIRLRIFSPMPPFYAANDFIDWLMHRIKAIELHELCEWFRIDGGPWIDPHRPL